MNWFEYWIGECPVCGKDKSFKVLIKERPKPENVEDRYKFIPDKQAYDWCDVL